MGKTAKKPKIERVEHFCGKVDIICARTKSAQRHDSTAKAEEGRMCMYMVESPKVDMRVKVQA